MTSTRSASSHAAAGISVESVVGAALTVIARDGVAGLTMRAVAEHLGVRAPSLYHHVRDKDALLTIVARDAFASLAEDRDAYDRVATVDGWIALTASGSRRLRRFYAGHPGLAALIQSTATPDRSSRDGTRGALIRAQINALVRLGIPPKAARDIFETSARWTLAAVAAETAVGASVATDDERLFDRGLDWFMHGLRTELDRLLERKPAI